MSQRLSTECDYMPKLLTVASCRQETLWKLAAASPLLSVFSSSLSLLPFALSCFLLLNYNLIFIKRFVDHC